MLQVVSEVDLMRDGYLSSSDGSRIIGIQHLPDQAAVCIATSRGDILLWTPSSDQPQVFFNLLRLPSVRLLYQRIANLSWPCSVSQFK